MSLKSLQLEEAVAAFTQGASALPSESRPLLEALGCVLAENAVSQTDQPPFPRSPLDGYALLSSDSAGASRERPVTLKVIDRVCAGDTADVKVTPGAAVRIMTGGMLPEGCDCVIRQEDTDYGEDFVNIYTYANEFDNYCRQGEDFKAGDVLIPRGTKINASAVSVLACAGFGSVRVSRKPRVFVISTGDELVAPGEPLPKGKIYNSNLFYITSRLSELGAAITGVLTSGDDRAQITSALLEAVKTSDLVITTGGVSVGQKDLMPAATKELGAELVFHGVAMKPGSPVLYTRLAGVPVLSLSGNPFASAVTFELFARKLLAKFMGDDTIPMRRVNAVLASDFLKPSPGRRLIRGVFSDGQVSLSGGHSSGQIHSMVGCNCFVDIPAGTALLSAGDAVSVLLM